MESRRPRADGKGRPSHRQPVMALHRADVLGRRGTYGDGGAFAAPQLDLERGAVAVAMDDGAHVSRNQPGLGEVAIQGHGSQRVDHGQPRGRIGAHVSPRAVGLDDLDGADGDRKPGRGLDSAVQDIVRRSTRYRSLNAGGNPAPLAMRFCGNRLNADSGGFHASRTRVLHSMEAGCARPPRITSGRRHHRRRRGHDRDRVHRHPSHRHRRGASRRGAGPR